MRFLSTLLFIILLGNAQAQDTLLLTSGKKIVVIDSVTSNHVYYHHHSPNFLQKLKGKKNKKNITKVLFAKQKDGKVMFRRSLSDTLYLLNGKKYLISFNEMDGEFLHYYKLKFKNNKVVKAKKKRVNEDNVFYVSTPDSVHYYYEKDSTLDNYLSVPDMKIYLLGVRHANAYYKAPKNFTAGFVSGFIGGYLGTTWGLIPPAIYGAVAGSIKIDESQLNKDFKYYNNAVYQAGFHDQARMIQRNKAVIGGLIGFAASITTFQILADNNML